MHYLPDFQGGTNRNCSSYPAIVETRAGSVHVILGFGLETGRLNHQGIVGRCKATVESRNQVRGTTACQKKEAFLSTPESSSCKVTNLSLCARDTTSPRSRLPIRSATCAVSQNVGRFWLVAAWRLHDGPTNVMPATMALDGIPRVIFARRLLVRTCGVALPPPL